MYLFDILLLGPMAFKNGISTILENTEILKVSPVNTTQHCFVIVLMMAQVCFHPQVLHNCREIAHCLMGQFQVKLNNIFDTQVRLFRSTVRPTLWIFMLLWCFLNLTFSHLLVLRWQMSYASTQLRGASFPTELAH